MTKTVTILLVIGLIAILSFCDVSGRRPGKRDFCQLSPERGRCRRSSLRWFYDSASGECRNFTWGGCGGNDNKFAAKSLCERVCKRGCRYDSCTTTCPNGFIIDSDGCNTCRCQPRPGQDSCPSVECPTTCTHGYQTDSDGCMTCHCRAEAAQSRVARTSPQHQCPPVCFMYCPHGNKQDEYGCDICACKSKEEACGSQQCMMECATGFATDSRGCDTCECNPVSETDTDKNLEGPDCTKHPMCKLYCRHGFLKGRDGCDLCLCASRRTQQRLVRIERRRLAKESVDSCGVRPMCAMYCPQGFQKDKQGCDTCACRQDPPVHVAQLPAGNTSNSPSQLPSNIPSQLPAQLPANIPAQQPAEIPAQLPVNSECSAMRCHKYKQCAFGFEKDEDGCDTCVCGNRRSRSRSSRNPTV